MNNDQTNAAAIAAAREDAAESFGFVMVQLDEDGDTIMQRIDPALVTYAGVPIVPAVAESEADHAGD